MRIDHALVLRSALEFAMLIPGFAFAMIPVRKKTRYRPATIYSFAAALIIFTIFTGSFIAVSYHLPTEIVLIAVIPSLFLAYVLTVDLTFSKKLFCFLNAIMLSEFCSTYTQYATVHLEVDDFAPYFTVFSSLVCFGITVIVFLISFRTLWKRLPYLLDNYSLDAGWRALVFVPLVMSVLCFWIAPESLENVLIGRLQAIALILLPFVLIINWLFLYVFWWTARRLSAAAKVEQQNTLLNLEVKRYDELLDYINETRNLRHDFRHHIIAIDELAKSGDNEKLQDYLSQFTELVDRPVRMFANPIVDAVAAHYDKSAEAHGVTVDWGLSLPEDLPVSEADFCSIMGNTVENAIRAVENLPADMRRVSVTASMLSDEMIGYSVKNPYKGKIAFKKNGLPRTKAQGHGIGLESVANITKKYNGSLQISAKDGIFSISIILYGKKEEEPVAAAEPVPVISVPKQAAAVRMSKA